MMKSVSGPLMVEYKMARQRGLIESGILPLCDALYETGAHPLSSCDGHPRKATWFWFEWVLSFLMPKNPVRPFVLFSCSLAYAKAYEKELIVKEDLNYHWRLLSYIHPLSNDLVWIIEPNDARLDCGDAEPVKLNSDISGLATVAARIHDAIPQRKVSEECK